MDKIKELKDKQAKQRIKTQSNLMSKSPCRLNLLKSKTAASPINRQQDESTHKEASLNQRQELVKTPTSSRYQSSKPTAIQTISRISSTFHSNRS